MIYTIALTGGIGSGKSTVANFFSQLNITVIDTDIIAHKIVEPNKPALKAIIKYFSRSIINQDGTLNRRALREQIFSVPDDKAWLNALLHPLIYREMQRQTAAAKSPYIIWVVPLLVENQLYNKVDRVLLVDVAPEKQIQRTVKRDNVSQMHAEQIFLTQATREERLVIADDIIDNNSTISAIELKVLYLHMQYLQFAMQAKVI